MAIRGKNQIKNGTVVKDNINISDSGDALVTKIIAGGGIFISSTGADDGTGEVTVETTGGSSLEELMEFSNNLSEITTERFALYYPGLGDYYATLIGLANSLHGYFPNITGGKTTNPTVNDDETGGYLVGDIWLNKTNDKAFIMLDKSSGNAVWKQISISDGWFEISTTWTRTGDHTFTASGDVTATYRKGTKIRYKQGGGFEYGVIGASSYSAPNTTITLITNNDYAMAAGALTDTAISYIENPEGFPTYFNYTPTPAGGGSMTIASSTINFARWWTANEICHWSVDVSASFGGTAHNSFLIPLPVASLFANIPFPANCRDTGASALPVGTGTQTTTDAIFRKADVSVWTLAATSRVYGYGCYPF